jgi:hypothetical protein
MATAISLPPFQGVPYTADNAVFDEFVNYEALTSDSTQTSSKQQEQAMPPQSLVNNEEQYEAQITGPTHEYGLFRQQTGMPKGGLHSMMAESGPQSTLTEVTAQFASLGHSPIDWNLSSANPAMANLDVDMLSCSDGVHSGNRFESDEVPPDRPPKVYPGFHTAQQQQRLQQQQQQQQHQSQRQHQQVSDQQQTNAVITRVLNDIRQNSQSLPPLPADGREPTVATLAKAKKEWDEMDEDERKLHGPEAKNMTPKEKRQLRNKVSARHFRTRRKNQLAELVELVKEQQESLDALRTQNRSLLQENHNFQVFVKEMLGHEAFRQFVHERSQRLSGSDQHAMPPVSQADITTSNGDMDQGPTYMLQSSIMPTSAAPQMSFSQSGTSQMGFQQSGNSLPGLQQPGHSQPGLHQPGHSQIGLQQPGNSQTGLQQTGHSQTLYQQQAVYMPVTVGQDGSHDVGISMTGGTYDPPWPNANMS